ncbi:MFS transporter [Saccharothrix coeruleofusca]|uniref:MFS transporter n=1 Tax=Saccharothrix coeruleofusca TaxID=33919 RepID=A0A918AKE2_9PSEU|nr:MFS transporter [Saccharothrix coeruleofusca]GGP38077.1 MFS transporter [Saccharothrix coeruleofusca]
MTDPLAEPVAPVRRPWVAWLFLANLGLWLGIYAPLQVLLPQQVELLDPVRKEFLFGLVTGVGAVVALVVNPLVGRCSDRTTSRWGRRHPWTLGGALVGAAGLAVLASAASTAAVVAGWCLAQAGLNGMLAALTSAVPDRVPVGQRARVGGLVGISQMLGTVVGAVLVTVLVSGLSAGYWACAAAVVLGAAAFVLRTPDARLPEAARPAPRGGSLLPRWRPDFAWAWGAHFAINLGNGFGTLYLLYFLDDVVRHPSPADGLLVLMLLYGVALVAGAVVLGARSDRSGKRRGYVHLAAAAMALAALLLAVWPTWTAALVAAPLLGAGFGGYWAVALALLTQVLPAAEDRARDLGVVNVANSLPQVLAPLLTPAVLAHLGGYRGLFLVSAAVTVSAALLVGRVRSVG